MNESPGARQSLALVGIGCRFPGGADTPARLWELLRNGTDAVMEIPADRWDIESLYDPDYRAPGRTHQRHGGFIDRIREFDAAFFGISPKEAKRIDPQQRILLEAAHQALEDAGIPPFGLARSSTGVFVGVSTHDYGDLQARSHEHRLGGPHTNQGGALSIAANRISYVLDLHGPSLAIDTACSSTLYALHVASLSLQNGDCDLALVGGVNALLMPGPTTGFSSGMFLSARGRCQAFSAHADGFVRAEGAGVVVLKPLARAVADGDRIYAVLRHTAVNEDGRTEGMALPSFDVQAALLEKACRQAALDPREVGYVEAHGTGTVAGDEVEARALGTVLGRGRAADRPCLVGSVKTNLGHLEAGAAAVGMIKLALCLHHREIPRSLHSDELNPKIPFSDLRLEVVREHRAWPEWNRPPLAGLSSFGFGGANAYAIFEAAPEAAAPSAPADAPVVAALSARSDEALRDLALRHLERSRCGGPPLADVAYSTICRRDHHPVRAAVVARDRAQWEERLEALAAGRAAPGLATGRAPAAPGPIAFVCSGQGPQWWAMGRELFHTDRIFRASIEEVDALFRPLASWRLIEELFERDAETSRVDETWLTQPALFAVQVALARRFWALGVQPAAVVGHSVGEVSAAVIGGALPLDRGVFVIYHRSRIQNEASGSGRMLAVGLPEVSARKRIDRFGARISIAAINRPELVTLAGDADAIDEVARDLEAEGIFHRDLAVKVPFHSHHMDSLRGALIAALGSIAAGEAGIALYSTVTGRRARGPELSGDYWFRNVREPVRFVAAIRAMIHDGYRSFVELSPHPILSPGIEDLLREANAAGAAVPSLRRGAGETETLLGALGGLYTRGQTIAPAQPGRFVELPLYPWQRETFWCETEEGRLDRLATRPHPLVRRRRSSLADASRHVFELEFDARVDRWLRDHRLQEQIVVPAAALIEAALACGRDAFGEDVFLEEVSFEHALFLPEGDEDPAPRVELEVDGDDGQFAIASHAQTGETTRHVRGFLRHRGETFPTAPAPTAELLACCTPVIGPEKLYPLMAERGLQLGPLYETLREISGRALDTSRAEAIARITLGKDIRTDRYAVHPVLLDGCFQSLCAVPFVIPGLGTRVYIPVGARRVRLRKTQVRDFWACARVLDASERHVSVDFWLVDDAGRVAAEVHGFEGRLLEGSDRRVRPDEHCYELRWVPCDRPDQKWHRHSAAVLAALERIESGVRESARALLAELPNSARAALDARLDRLALAHIVRTFAGLGVVWEPGSHFPARLPSVAPALHDGRLLRRLLRALEEAGLTAADSSGSDFRVLRAPDAEPIDALEAALADEGKTRNDAALVGEAGRNLGAVLRGEKDGVEVLFATGAAKNLGTFYREHYHIKHSTTLLIEAFRGYIRDLPAGRTLRILEVGAGTGSMTEALVAELPADGVEYVFTDVSPAFFADAKAKLRYPDLQFAVLDLERDAQDQGFAPGGFDLVVAGNVLHATSDLRATLRRVGGLLGNGGVLLATEVTRAPLALDLVFGLTEGWWSFRDEDLRAGHATLDVAGWNRALAETGFGPVIAATYQDEALANSGQHVLIAQWTGMDAAPEDFSPPDNPAREHGSALIVGEAKGLLGQALESRLRASGLAAEKRGPQQLGDVLRTLPQPIRVVVDLHATAVAGRHFAAGDLAALHARTTRPQMTLAAELARAGLQPPPRLVLVTCGAAALAGDRTVDPSQAPVWGVGRTIPNEYQHLPVLLVDLPAAPDDKDIDALARECLGPSDDVDVAIRGERRFVLRVDRVAPESGRARPAGPADAFRLEIERRGVLETMAFRRCARPTLAPNAVEIEVKAAALNFRDVMNAMGLLPAELELPEFGFECSGMVSRVGDGVTDLRPGDEVIAFSTAALSRYAVAPRLSVVRKPANLRHEDAAAVPTALGTAWYCLEEVARLRPGERVLIHSATGGVGHAAIQVARRRGAEILATAGTEAKRAYLRHLGIRHVFDSRSMRWVEEAWAATGGKGVDVILNSLSGSAIPRGLELLAPLGRFVEIGVTDIFENRRIGLGSFRRATAYFAVELDVLRRELPEVLQSRVLQPLAALLESGELQPLPATVVPASEIREAFRLMSRSQHRGKIVVSLTADGGVPIVADPDPLVLDRGRTFLVTGGTRGFGFRLAEWLVERGARHLVLVGRSGRLDPETAATVDGWRARGITVRLDAVDAGDETAIESELASVRREMPPLGGIVHAAMVLADAPIETLDDARFIAVLDAKAGGALNLDRLTREDDLAFFILLSSVATVVGNPGQANYNAANLVLESIAHRRRLEGRPATVLNLGVVAEVGYVARNEHAGTAYEKRGVAPMPTAGLLALVERALREQATQRIVGVLHPRRIVAMVPSNAARFGRLVDAGGGAVGRGSGLLAEIEQLARPMRAARLATALLEAVARITGADAAKVPADRRLTDLGLDSLMATQLSSWLQVTLGANVPTMRLLKGPTIAELASELAPAIGATAAEFEGPAPAMPDLASATSRIQAAIFADHVRLPGSSMLSVAALFEGRFDEEAARRSFERLIDRHPLLRSRFSAVGGELQRSQHDGAVAWLAVAVESDAALDAALAADAIRAFDLDRDPPLRALLCRLSANRWVLQITAHHLVYDGAIVQVWDELLTLYRLEIGDATAEPMPATPYDRFVAFEREYLASARYAEDRQYWHEKLSGSTLRLDVGAVPHDGTEDWIMANVPVPLPRELSLGVHRFAATRDATPYIVLATAYLLALRAEFGGDDLIVGSSVSLRDLPEFQAVVGPLINFIPLRVDLSGAPAFDEALARVRHAVAEALDHRFYPFGTLLEELAEPAALARMPRLGLNVNFNYYNLDGLARGSESARLRTPEFHEIGGGVRMANYPVQGLPVIRPYDLTFGVFQMGGHLQAGLRHNTRLLHTDRVERVAHGFLDRIEDAVVALHGGGTRMTDLVDSVEREH